MNSVNQMIMRKSSEWHWSTYATTYIAKVCGECLHAYVRACVQSFGCMNVTYRSKYVQINKFLSDHPGPLQHYTPAK